MTSNPTDDLKIKLRTSNESELLHDAERARMA